MYFHQHSNNCAKVALACFVLLVFASSFCTGIALFILIIFVLLIFYSLSCFYGFVLLIFIIGCNVVNIIKHKFR